MHKLNLRFSWSFQYLDYYNVLRIFYTSSSLYIGFMVTVLWSLLALICVSTNGRLYNTHPSFTVSILKITVQFCQPNITNRFNTNLLFILSFNSLSRLWYLLCFILAYGKKLAPICDNNNNNNNKLRWQTRWWFHDSAMEKRQVTHLGCDLGWIVHDSSATDVGSATQLAAARKREVGLRGLEQDARLSAYRRWILRPHEYRGVLVLGRAWSEDLRDFRRRSWGKFSVSAFIRSDPALVQRYYVAREFFSGEPPGSVVNSVNCGFFSQFFLLSETECWGSTK